MLTTLTCRKKGKAKQNKVFLSFFTVYMSKILLNILPASVTKSKSNRIFSGNGFYWLENFYMTKFNVFQV